MEATPLLERMRHYASGRGWAASWRAYVQEVAQEEDADYWEQFADLDELIEDFRLYVAIQDWLAADEPADSGER